MQLQSKLPKCYTGTGAKTSKTKTPKTNCKVLPNLKYYTILGICYTCVAMHMGAVLWSAVFHAALHSTQLLEPLQDQC